MIRYFWCASIVTILLLAACNGDDSPREPSATDDVGLPTLTGIQGQLAAIVLQQSDVPEGLEGSAPSFSTNEDIAGLSAEVMQTLVQQGRQLGVDVQFLPTDRLDPASPLRGGIQSSASVYMNSLGATETYQKTVSDARANNWEANYPDILDMKVTEVPRLFGDESLWLRLAGKDCVTNALPGDPAPTCDGEQQTVIIDNVILRIGRVRAYLQVSTIFPADAAPDAFEEEISQFAMTVVQHAGATFPSA
jgi:hypothetical protein